MSRNVSGTEENECDERGAMGLEEDVGMSPERQLAMLVKPEEDAQRRQALIMAVREATERVFPKLMEE